MKIPIVKEWGSWAVFFSSVLTGLVAGSRTEPSGKDREFVALTAMAIAGMTFLINFKSPLASVLRTRGAEKEHIGWALFYSFTGLALLAPFISAGIGDFLIFSVLVPSYVILLYKGREHSLFAEFNGFALLTLSAPVVFFAVTGELSLRLYAAVLVFFGAGVFKVRVRVRKTLKYRWIMVFYCVVAGVVYSLLGISLVILLPLFENVLSVILMREEKLKVTGYTELAKSLVFIFLMSLFWN